MAKNLQKCKIVRPKMCSFHVDSPLCNAEMMTLVNILFVILSNLYGYIGVLEKGPKDICKIKCSLWFTTHMCNKSPGINWWLTDWDSYWTSFFFSNTRPTNLPSITDLTRSTCEHILWLDKFIRSCILIGWIRLSETSCGFVEKLVPLAQHFL